MKEGKLAEHIRKRAVCPRLTYKNEGHEMEAGAGRETAFFSWDTEGRLVITQEAAVIKDEKTDVKTDVKTAKKPDRKTDVNTDVNTDVKTELSLLVQSIKAQLVSAFAAPVGIMAELILPKDYTEIKLRAIMSGLSEAAGDCGLDLAAVDTRFTSSVACPIVTATGVGIKKSSEKSPENRKVDDIKPLPEQYSIIMAGWCGTLGTRLLYQDEELREGFSKSFLKSVREIFADKKDAGQFYFVNEAAAIMAERSIYMRTGSHTGVFGGLWDLSEDLKTGFRVDLDKIPIRQETIELCERKDVSPYEIEAQGCILCVTKCPGPVMEALIEKGIPAATIGYLTAKKEKCILGEITKDGEREVRFLDSPR